MSTRRGRRTQSESDDQDSDGVGAEVYDIPVPGRCRVAGTRFCRYVPFMPCYVRPDINCQQRRALTGVYHRRRRRDEANHV